MTGVYGCPFCHEEFKHPIVIATDCSYAECPFCHGLGELRYIETR